MPMTDPILELQGPWSELHAGLRVRFRALSDEMRSYPTPIARCDEQLTRLIEQRDAVRTELERIAEVDANGGVATCTTEALDPFLAQGAADDEAIAAVRSRLAAALTANRSECDAAVTPILPSFPISEWR